jgi:hypothetical protein
MMGQNMQNLSEILLKTIRLQVKITILNWTCLLIPLKYIENQEQSGQVQFKIVM